MKRHITILGIIMSASVSAQTIDDGHFDEGKLNKVLFSQMSTVTLKNYSYPLVQTNIGEEQIYCYIKKKCDKLSLDELNAEINTKLLRKWDSKAISQTDLVGNVGFIARIPHQDFRTFQEIADRCISGWLNSENLIFLNWSQIGEAISYYNRRTQMVYVFFAYFN